jgi:regulator of sigma E protease
MSSCEMVLNIFDKIIIYFSTNGVSVNDFSGPVGIATVISQTDSIDKFLFITMALNINLFILNLLPVPALDGGHLAKFTLEALRRKPLSPEVSGFIDRIGYSLLLLLILFVTASDIIKLFSKISN